MIASEIMLPPHAPEIYLDRATLWNAVENCEKHPKAQLAYSFDIAMQNELTLEENMELTRKFVQEQFVTKGIIADLAFHSPDKGIVGIDTGGRKLPAAKTCSYGIEQYQV